VGRGRADRCGEEPEIERRGPINNKTRDPLSISGAVKCVKIASRRVPAGLPKTKLTCRNAVSARRLRSAVKTPPRPFRAALRDISSAAGVGDSQPERSARRTASSGRRRDATDLHVFHRERQQVTRPRIPPPAPGRPVPVTTAAKSSSAADPKPGHIPEACNMCSRPVLAKS